MEQLFYRTGAIIRYIMILLGGITVLGILILQIRHSKWFTAIYFAVTLWYKIKPDKIRNDFKEELWELIKKYQNKTI